MGRDDAVATAVRNARLSRDWTMRDVEHLTTQMAQQAPDMYAMFSRSSLSNLENEGAAFLASSTQYNSLRAVLHLLFESEERFYQITGSSPNYVQLSADSALNRTVPSFEEGQDLDREDLLAGRGSAAQVVPTTPLADYAVTVTSRRMLPFVSPGQVLHVALATAVQPGEMAVLNRAHALEVAWCVAPGEYAHAQGEGTFRLAAVGTVLGRVVSLTPFLPVKGADLPEPAQPSLHAAAV